ncbi:MAG: hypothetical protein UU21_C0003G0012 [Candidatus Levybacteria bacterium GW2011_GWA2_40_8]|nr:MAG: hypothetical protein UU21_C0003G0012 [Candidatus Levybacteria bacterium GW2011_GWA2_40_8]
MPDLFVSEKKETQKDTSATDQKPSEHKVLEAVSQVLPSDSIDRKVHLLTSYCENPTGLVFTNLDDDEKILLFLRRHLITNSPWIFKAILASLVPLLFLIFLSFFGVILPEDYTFTLVLFYYLMLLGYIFVQFISWFFNITLVTNQRVVDIDFSQLVFESVAATKLPQLEDVSYHQIGVLASVFDYGDVTVQTAGKASNFLFAQVPHPEKVVHLINNLIAKERNV